MHFGANGAERLLRGVPYRAAECALGQIECQDEPRSPPRLVPNLPRRGVFARFLTFGFMLADGRHRQSVNRKGQGPREQTMVSTWERVSSNVRPDVSTTCAVAHGS